MDYQIEVREVQKQPVAFVAKTTPQSELPNVIGPAIEEAYNALKAKDVQPSAPPFVRYTAWRESDCDIQVGFPVSQPIETDGSLQAGELGGSKAAFVLHKGDYQNLMQAYEAIMTWAKQNDKSIEQGDPWESYVTDPCETPKEDWRTEVYWPLP